MKGIITCVLISFFSMSVMAADVVPNEIKLPGTQPNEVSNFESPNKCDNCHAGYNTTDPGAEPATGWRGSAMGNAGRDPIFWATMAVAEQDFDGSGDLCIRCHSTGGWYAGHSTPTDGSGLAASDDDGVDCDTCHKMTNPNNSEHIGVMNFPFIANCSDDLITPDGTCQSADEGYYGSGMTSIWPNADKLGPYSDADARHQFMQSKFHRDVDYCGTCHDVSNSAVGDLAPGNGAQHGAPHVISSQDFNGGAPNLGGPLEEKAAFNNPPYAYGVVERTFSEYKSSALPTTPVSEFKNLPLDLQVPGGSLEVTYQAALAAGKGGDYADGDTRFFSCQSCHMRPTTSPGANKRGVQNRPDLPRHDLTGGNYWMADIIKYQDAKQHLRLGGDLNETQLTAIDLGQLRAGEHLKQAGSLELINNGDTLKVTNLTGHKLISGYPEGRRMWVNIKWYNNVGTLIREDGKYGPLVNDAGQPVTIANPAGGAAIQVESIQDLTGTDTKIYEAHYAMTKEWADTLIAVGKPATLPLTFNRYTGEIEKTLGDLAALSAGGHIDTFHFVLNNDVSSDNRIPPYGMQYDIAKIRNALPVPAAQYGGGTAGSVYNYWDELTLNPPAGADSANIDLLYQGTSWEYIQFLNNANNGIDPANGGNAFLGMEGINMLEAWLNTGMVKPYVMASITWGAAPPGGDISASITAMETGIYTTTGKGKTQTTTFNLTDTFNAGDDVVIRSTVLDIDGNPVSGAEVAISISGPETASLTGTTDAAGIAEIIWNTSAPPNKKGNGGTATGAYTATTTSATANGYSWDGVNRSTTFNIAQ